MPIRIKTDLEFGDTFFIKTDHSQSEHQLVGVIFMPGNQIKFKLSFMGDIVEVWDFETTRERDVNKIIEDED